jgi:hypothetical protein
MEQCPGPILTPLVVATMGEESLDTFGVTTTIGRPGVSFVEFNLSSSDLTKYSYAATHRGRHLCHVPRFRRRILHDRSMYALQWVSRLL